MSQMWADMKVASNKVPTSTSSGTRLRLSNLENLVGRITSHKTWLFAVDTS